MSNRVIRHAQKADLAALYALECQCFHVDRLSHRSFRRHLTSDTSELLIASEAGACVGYGLVLYRRGTRLARLYSLAVSPVARGRGIAPQIINHLEQHAAARGYHHMRLEVAKTNCSAIRLYQISGYRTFGEYQDYYQDHSDALRMQKCIRHVRDTGFRLQAPWWPQSTEFTCGPAALMMAMTALKPQQVLSIERELDIWREATTVFMTSGMGGCHPFGLALAGKKRGFHCQIWLNTQQPLFVDGVRSQHKKNILENVHRHFLHQCVRRHVPINPVAISFEDIRKALSAGEAVVILISTYRLDGKKAPHWVLVTGIDDDCLFVHDPDFDPKHQTPMDNQSVPIALNDFDRMSAFGGQRVRAALTIATGEFNPD